MTATIGESILQMAEDVDKRMKSIQEDVDKLMNSIQEDVGLMPGSQQRNLTLMADKPGRTLVQFRKLPEAHQEEENFVPDMFILELGYHDLLEDVVSRVADVLHVKHSRIRLARHDCRLNKPSSLIRPQNAYLLDFLRTSNKICNVLYYIVLLDPSKQEFSEIVDEVEACDRHEMQPQEENQVTYREHMIRLYHFTKTDGGKVSKIPFIKVAYNANETLAEVKERLQSQLGITKKEISKRKFAVLRPRGSTVYLEDTQVLYGSVKGKQTLGLETHGDGSFVSVEGTLE